jgi:Tol biopolymer transport system component
MKNAILVSGCPGEERGWNTQLLYFTGSSLSRDDKSLFLISDRDGSPNVIVRDLATGTRAVWYNIRIQHNEETR